MVPLLVIIPSLTQPPEKLAVLLGIALLKAVVVLAVILVFGQRVDAQVVPSSWPRQVVRSVHPQRVCSSR